MGKESDLVKKTEEAGRYVNCPKRSRNLLKMARNLSLLAGSMMLASAFREYPDSGGYLKFISGGIFYLNGVIYHYLTKNNY